MYSSRATFFRLFWITKYAKVDIAHRRMLTWQASRAMVAEVYAGGAEIGPYNHDERMAPNCVTVAAKAIADVRRIKGAVLLDSHALRAG